MDQTTVENLEAGEDVVDSAEAVDATAAAAPAKPANRTRIGS